MNQICVQEQHIPATTIEAKWEIARSWGYDGIELRGRGEGEFLARLPELRRAVRAGAVLPTVCVEMPHFVGAFDAELRRDAVAQMKQQLTVMAEIGGRGAMTPASWGMFSTRLPPFTPPRTPEQDRKVLLEGLGELAEHAEHLGVEIYLEPLNRYEDHMVNTLATAMSLVDDVARRSLRVAADTYHMNIEERDPYQALLDAGDHVGHIQASDSNRLEPGAGHVDWARFGAAVRAAGYTGPIAVESRLSGPAQDVLPRVPDLLRSHL
jgi:sugar phosphate isomerase/epimerase